MVLPQEPEPNEKIDATWGRDVIRAIRRCQPQGGPGMRVTCGPNGSTYVSTGKKTGASTGGTSASSDYPLKLVAKSIGSGSNKRRYATCLINDGALQSDGECAESNNATIIGSDSSTQLSNGWVYVAASFDSEGEQVTTPLETLLPNANDAIDVYGFVYWDYETVGGIETAYRACVVQMDEDWPSVIDADDRIGRVYVGTFNRHEQTYVQESGTTTVVTFPVQNQALRSGIAVCETGDEDIGPTAPFALMVDEAASGQPVAVYAPGVFVDGALATVDNAVYGATGSGWYGVTGEANESGTTDVVAFLDMAQTPPHVLVQFGPTAPLNYDEDTGIGIGRIESVSGTKTVEEQWIVGTENRNWTDYAPYPPFHVADEWVASESAHAIEIFNPVTYVNGELADVANDETGASGSEWYLVDMSTTGNDARLINGWIDATSPSAPRVYFSDDTTAPTGFADGKIEVAEIELINGNWRTTWQYLTSAVRFDAEGADKPFTLKVDSNRLLVYLPTGCAQSPKTYQEAAGILVPNMTSAGDGWYVVSSDLATDISAGSDKTAWFHEDFQNNRFVINFTDCQTADHSGFQIGKVTRSATGDTYAVTQYVDTPQVVYHVGPTGGGGGGGSTVNVESSTVPASGSIVTYESAGASGVVNLKYHGSVLGTAVNPGSTAAGIVYNSITYTTVNGLLEAVLPETGIVISSDNLNDDFDPTSDTVLSTADMAAGTAGTVTGDVLTYDATNGKIYTNEYLTASNVAVHSTAGGESADVLLSGYFNTAGLFKYDSIGLNSEEQQGVTSPKFIGFNGTPEAAAFTAELIDGVVLAPTGNDPSVAHWPKADSVTGEIGTSEYAARADHKHPIETGVGTLIEKTTSTTDDETSISGFSFDTSTWTPGENGIKLPVCVRCFSTNNDERCMVFRDVTISRNGTIANIGAEYAMYIMQYYG